MPCRCSAAQIIVQVSRIPVGLAVDYNGLAYMYTIDPYGSATQTQSSGGLGDNTNPYLFEGGLQDRTTGLVKFGTRWYSPTIGRWIQQDTLNAPLDPSNANRYQYAGSDPINAADLTGQGFPKGLATVVGAVGGSISGSGPGGIIGGTLGSFFGPEGTVPGYELGMAVGAAVGAGIGAGIGASGAQGIFPP